MVGIVDGVLQLIEAVVQGGLFEHGQADAIVEDADAAADHGLLPPVLGVAGRPGEPDARRNIFVIADQGLHFIAKTHAESQIGLNAPVVLNERAGVPANRADVRLAGLNAETRRTAAERLDLGCVEARLLQ